jgi:hypothetical protein
LEVMVVGLRKVRPYCQDKASQPVHPQVEACLSKPSSTT